MDCSSFRQAMHHERTILKKNSCKKRASLSLCVSVWAGGSSNNGGIVPIEYTVGAIII